MLFDLYTLAIFVNDRATKLSIVHTHALCMLNVYIFYTLYIYDPDFIIIYVQFRRMATIVHDVFLEYKSLRAEVRLLV